MKIQVGFRSDYERIGHAETFKADRWYLDDHQNLILKRGESDIAVVGSDHWVFVRVVEEQKSEESP